MTGQKGFQPRVPHFDGKKESILNDPEGSNQMGISADANPKNVDQKFNQLENRVHNTSRQDMEQLIEDVNVEKDALH